MKTITTGIAPCVDVSKDGGRTWEVWAYWRDTQEELCIQACARLRRNYPEWQFRTSHLGDAALPTTWSPMCPECKQWESAFRAAEKENARLRELLIMPARVAIPEIIVEQA